MPHSVSSQPSPPRNPTGAADAAMEEAPTVTAVATGNDSTDDAPNPAEDGVQTSAAEIPEQAPPTAVKEEQADSGDVDMADVPVKNEDATATEVNLDELFADDDDDDDDDDEFPSSLAAQAPPQNLSELPASDPEVMRSFYQRLFPWRYLFQWLNHSPTPTADFGNREFAFTLQNDAYLRYQSYPTADLLRKDVLRLMPSRFEIGPVYSTNPRERKTLEGARGPGAFRPVSKELCFDIDLTDYDDIRTCCDKATICRRCWQFITMAIAVVDAALRDDFGFRHILWVYSGRRGAHAWVCDRRARALDDTRRRAIAGYLEVLRGGSQAGKRVNVRRPLHPHLTRSLAALRTHFLEDVLAGQDPWASDDPDQDAARAEKLLALLPDRNLAAALRQRWAAAPGRPSTAKWADINVVAKTGTIKGLDPKALLEAKQDIVLEYTYPRLDIEVSKKLNHLLKSPFVVHPGTGRVCVPIDPRNAGAFDPLGVPTVQGLLQEIDAWQENQGPADAAADAGADADADADANGTEDGDGKKKTLQDWEKTSLRPYIEQFRSFVLALVRDETADIRIKREREEAGGMEF